MFQFELIRSQIRSLVHTHNSVVCLCVRIPAHTNMLSLTHWFVCAFKRLLVCLCVRPLKQPERHWKLHRARLLVCLRARQHVCHCAAATAATARDGQKAATAARARDLQVASEKRRLTVRLVLSAVSRLQTRATPIITQWCTQRR